LGGLAVHRGDRRLLGAAAQPRRMALLAMVARAGSRGVGRDRLQAVLWPDADGDSGRHALKQALYALRRDSEAPDLFLGTRELGLNPDDARADVNEFEDLLRLGQPERAVALYEGPFLDGFRLTSVPEFEHWVEEERRGLERSLAEALESLARVAQERGDPLSAVQWSRRLAALEPLNERLTVALMRALLAAGDRVGALRQARIYEELIAQELDLPPHQEVVELAREIREGKVLPAAAPAVAIASGTGGASPGASGEQPKEASGGAGPSVAVLPFGWSAADAEAGPLADGLTEELISVLARVPDLRVSGRTPLTPAGGVVEGELDLATLGARYGVSFVVEGAVRRSEDQVRVSARLLRVQGGELLWTGRYDRRLGPPLALQDELALAIAEEVERELRRAAGLAPRPSRREQANRLYAEGVRAWSPQGAGLGQGLDQFRQAIALDPGHAAAHAALAESYTQLAFYGFLPATRAADLAARAADEAIRLAPDRAESRLARGTCLLWVERRFEEGIAELERALAIDPTLVTAHARLAFVRLCHDGPGDAGRAAERATLMAGATGLSRVMFGQQLLAAGRFDQAIEALLSAIDIEAPSFLAYHWLTVAYVQKGQGPEALAAAVAEASLSDRHPWSLMSLVVASAAAGQHRRAETLLETLAARAATGYVQASVLAQAHAAIGDLDTGIALLERAIDEHDPSMMMIRVFPMFRVFHSHPGFRPLLRRAGWRDWDTAELPIHTG